MLPKDILEKLNQPGSQNRLDALHDISAQINFPQADPRYINNHIHTIYSFSPYSPTAAVFGAKYFGLCTAGIIDHDSIAGAEEFRAAGEIIDLPTTVGMECRARTGDLLNNRRTNNPDQPEISYMTFHAVPHGQIDRLQQFFAPYRELRNKRNREIVHRINQHLGPKGISIDFDMDVLPISMYDKGGTVTERHLMFALGSRMMDVAGKGEVLVGLLQRIDIAMDDKQRNQLSDRENPYYEYDLLGILKSSYLPNVYIPATEECPPLAQVVEVANETGAILCYAYLGDVTSSVTGDKKPQQFEDGYLEELFQVLYENGIRAITYMPPRNTREQLDRLRGLCERYGMFQISGEDINSPRQHFVCKAMEDPQFANLIDATWALIAHERGEKPIILQGVI